MLICWLNFSQEIWCQWEKKKKQNNKIIETCVSLLTPNIYFIGFIFIFFYYYFFLFYGPKVAFQVTQNEDFIKPP